MRTADMDGAHVEYLPRHRESDGREGRSRDDAEWLQDLIRILNPNNEPGRLTLIHRFGAKTIEDDCRT